MDVQHPPDMSSNGKSVCIICNEGATAQKRLIDNSAMIDELISSCVERVSLGQNEMQTIIDRLKNHESERKQVFYHSECRKPIVNKTMIERLRAKRSHSASSALHTPGPGRPSTSVESCRPKRKKFIPKAEVCLFAACTFCSSDSTEPLHRVLSDNMGKTLLDIKLNSQDDQVRTAVADLQDPGDASALEKFYHRKCLRYAQRSFSPHDCDSPEFVRSLCDEQLLTSVQNSLTDEGVRLNMAEVNQNYLSILKRYHLELTGTENYRRHLKNLITDRIPGVQFIKPLRRNEPDYLVLQAAVSKAVDKTKSDNHDTIVQLKTMAHILRQELLNLRKWSFTGSFEDFENPPLLQFFLTHLLFGKHSNKISATRDEEADKTVDVACQVLIQNLHSDRQVKLQPKTDAGFRQTIQTPLSLGLPLAIHSRIRDKNLVSNLSDVYIGSDYKKILDLEKRVEQAVLQRMKDAGGFCLPDFAKRGVNVWFAVDNIDLLEDTPTGQNTFHGTVIVMNQRAEDGDPVNDPLVIPDRLAATCSSLAIKYMQEPIIRTKPIRFNEYTLSKRMNLLSTEFSRTWALANYFSDDNLDQKLSSQMVGTQDNHELDLPEEQGVQATPDNEEHLQGRDVGDGETANSSILTVNERGRKDRNICKEAVMPTWAATKSLLLSSSSPERGRTNTEVIAPLFKTSPTDYATLYTVLMLTQGISASVVGPDRRTLITLDLDLYNRAIQIQQSVGNNNWILRAGALHIAFAALHALGKTIDGSGIDTCAIESGTYTSAALRGIYSGKAYKRGMEYHITTSLAIMMLKFDAISSSLPPGPLHASCAALRESLHARRPDMVEIFDGIQSKYSEVITTDGEDAGDLALFLTRYIEQVDSLLHLVTACRSGNWEGYLAALENQIKYFFSRDLLNYARLMPIHLAQMNALEQEDPGTWEALKTGDFVVARSEIPFTCLYTDQSLEQEIKTLKHHGGMVGLSRDEGALDRLITTTPYLSRIVKLYLSSFPRASKSTERHEHHQLSGDVAVRSRANAMKLRNSIELHCGGNPFKEKIPLKNVVSSAVVPATMTDDILHFDMKGQKRFEQFIHDRLLADSRLSVWDKMTKMKLKTFTTMTEKSKVRVGDKIIKLREERELLSRFLIIQRSRPELVPKLEETIGEYEMSVVPRSLCAVDGSLYVPTDKASLMHAIEGVESQSIEPAPCLNTAGLPRVLVVDAMAVLQSMKKTSSMRSLADLQEAFIKRIEWMLNGYSEGRIVFDRYLDQSLKNKTRQKRATTHIDFEIHSKMKLTMSIKELLSSTKTKRDLTAMLAKGLMECNKHDKVKLVVVYENTVKGHNWEEVHDHEEADTLIPHQVLASANETTGREICVWSPDTDVLTLLLDLVARDRLGAHSRLLFLTGKGTKQRQIDVIGRVKAIGRRKCQGLIGLHNFSGADWGGKFIGISKKTWVNLYLMLDEGDPIIECFRELGERDVTMEMVNDDFPQELKGLEEFVCRAYCSKGPGNLPALRWELFCSKNLEGEMLPPTRAALLPHIARANYISMRDKSYKSSCPDLPPIEDNGWSVRKGAYLPVRCMKLPAPQAVIELTKCACKTGCKNRCSCFRNGLPCTPLCKCYVGDCRNTISCGSSDNDRDGDYLDDE